MAKKPAETYVKLLYDSLSEKQRKEMCFDWNHVAGKRGVLPTLISNNSRLTKPGIQSSFYVWTSNRCQKNNKCLPLAGGITRGI